MYTYTHKVVAFMYVIKNLKHIRTQTLQHIKTLGPSGAYVRQWDKPSIVQIKTSRLVSAKQLSKPILTYWQSDFWEKNSMKFESKYMWSKLLSLSWSRSIVASEWDTVIQNYFMFWHEWDDAEFFYYVLYVTKNMKNIFAFSMISSIEMLYSGMSMSGS